MIIAHADDWKLKFNLSTLWPLLLIFKVNVCSGRLVYYTYKVWSKSSAAVLSVVWSANRPELFVGPFSVTRPDPTHQLSDPTQSNPLQI